MFIKRALFCPKYSALEKAQMAPYLSMLKIEIRQFVSTQRYSILFELKDVSRRWEIEIEIQNMEERQDLV